VVPPVIPPSSTVDQNGSLGTCPAFPADNAWNRDVSGLPVDANSQHYIDTILASGTNKSLHADFGGGGAYGIPYITVPGTQPRDRHILAVDRTNCKLYELFGAQAMGNHWDASSGAVFDLRSNALRPDSWTSADAAGLPIFPGLVRYDEVASGHINHALRFTVAQTQRGYIHPATHWASSSTDPNRPPMGLQLRLKASFNVSGYTGQTPRGAQRAEEVRDDRRRQREQLVRLGRGRQSLERRRPEPAEDDPGQCIRSREHGRGHPPLTALVFVGCRTRRVPSRTQPDPARSRHGTIRARRDSSR
jgi:hypothetical protein